MYSDPEIAYYAEVYQAERVAPSFYARHEQALLAAGRRHCNGDEEVARAVLVDALIEWWRESDKGPELKPPLAVSWRRAGSLGTLGAYLERCIKNRQVDRARQWKKTTSLDDPERYVEEADKTTEAPADGVDPARLWRACECWVAATQRTAAALPQATLAYWLTALGERQARPLQKLLYPERGTAAGAGVDWKANPGTVNRLPEQFLRRRESELALARAAADLNAEDLAEARERYATCLFWGEMPGRPPWPALTQAEQARLTAFAAGIAPADRRATIKWIMGRPDAVRQLAKCLPARGSRGPEGGAPVNAPPPLPARFPVDPVLAGQRGIFYTLALHRSRQMRPADVAAKLGPVTQQVFACLIAATGADSGTLWLRQGDRLAAVLNPREKDVPGLTVPANRGFIHQCLRDEKAMSVLPRTLKDGARQWKEIDARLHRPVQAMAVAPYRQFGEVAGVVTLVRFSPEAPPFAASHLGDAVCFARWAGGLLEARLQRDAIRKSKEIAGRLEVAAVQVLSRMEPAALCQMLTDDADGPFSPPLLQRLFAWVLADAGAEAGTLWLQRADCLEAVINPHEMALIGHQQPMREGIIGHVFQTGVAELTQDVHGDRRYEPRIDRQVIQRLTQAMVTVPFTLLDRRCGVVTMVRHLRELGPLGPRALSRAKLLAALLHRHLEDALRFRLTDPCPELEWSEDPLGTKGVE